MPDQLVLLRPQVFLRKPGELVLQLRQPQDFEGRGRAEEEPDQHLHMGLVHTLRDPTGRDDQIPALHERLVGPPRLHEGLGCDERLLGTPRPPSDM
eukprot:14653211-Alexandrium_andersonii.AAC.1